MSKTIDAEVLESYNRGIEKNRLKTDLGLIEFERTKEIILENIPKSSIIYDIGGGYGEYSCPNWMNNGRILNGVKI